MFYNGVFEEKKACIETYCEEMLTRTCLVGLLPYVGKVSSAHIVSLTAVHRISTSTELGHRTIGPPRRTSSQLPQSSLFLIPLVAIKISQGINLALAVRNPVLQPALHAVDMLCELISRSS